MTRVTYLGHLRQQLGVVGTVVEVGVFTGVYAAKLLQHLHPTTLTLVDAWRAWPPAVGYADYPGDPQAVWDLRYAAVQQRFAADARVRLLRTTSTEGAAQIPDGSVDLVYIDANHDAAHVLEDLRAWAPKLTPRGVLGGHDVCDAHYGVTEGCRAFFGAAWADVLITDEKRLPLSFFAPRALFS